MEKNPQRPALATILKRGLKKKCPHCGRGDLFERGIHLFDTCGVCGIRLLRNQGDYWAFLLVIDRAVFILPLIAIIYFDLLPKQDWSIIAFFAVMMGGFIATTSRRYGLCVGLDYLSRFYWGDPSDHFPDTSQIS